MAELYDKDNTGKGACSTLSLQKSKLSFWKLAVRRIYSSMLNRAKYAQLKNRDKWIRQAATVETKK